MAPLACLAPTQDPAVSACTARALTECSLLESTSEALPKATLECRVPVASMACTVAAPTECSALATVTVSGAKPADSTACMDSPIPTLERGWSQLTTPPVMASSPPQTGDSPGSS